MTFVRLPLRIVLAGLALGLLNMTPAELLAQRTEILKTQSGDSGAPTAKSKSNQVRRVNPWTYRLFDPTSGEPRSWYWRGAKGEFEFYDGSGFHPRTGTPLAVATKQVILEWFIREREMVKQHGSYGLIDAPIRREIEKSGSLSKSPPRTICLSPDGALDTLKTLSGC